MYESNEIELQPEAQAEAAKTTPTEINLNIQDGIIAACE